MVHRQRFDQRLGVALAAQRGLIFVLASKARTASR